MSSYHESCCARGVAEDRKNLWEAYGWFVAAYQEAADKLRKGDRKRSLIAGQLPPHLPFVPS